jgi:cell division transport system permease protein
MFGAMIFGSAFGNAIITQVKDKVDINVYFALNANESDILSLAKTVNKLPEVASTTYVSSSTALANFRDKWQNNSLILQGLDEVGTNPLPAMLNIKAKDPSQYAGITSFLVNNPIVDKVNYNDNKLVIERLSRIISLVQKAASIIAIIFIIIAIAIVLNTIRLVIYTAKDEIGVMKLVGASNMYARGPFVVSGIMYGIFSGVITLIILALASYNFDHTSIGFLMLSNLKFFPYFVQNFGQIFIIIMGSGIILGAAASYLAVRRYLKV